MSVSGARERRLWCLNLDAEEELRRGPRYQPTRGTLAAVAAARASALGLLGPEDVLLDSVRGAQAMFDQQPFHGCAWCPTPSALARLRDAGAIVPEAPTFETLREVNASRFPYDELGPRLAGACVVTTLDEAEGWLRQYGEARPVWLKRAFGAAGRGKLRVSGGFLEEHTRAFLTPAELALGVVLEPHVTVTLEVSQHALLAPDGSFVQGAPCVQAVERGRFVSVRAARAHELVASEASQLEGVIADLARALHRSGYFGPFGVDAYRYEDERGVTRWNACGELNARYTMGFAIGMAAALPSR